MIKSKRMRGWHVARMGMQGIFIGFWCENQKERDHLKVLDASGRIILNWILEKQDGIFLVCVQCALMTEVGDVADMC
jgi:hypothetical protein